MDFSDLCKTSADGANALLKAEPIQSGTYQCMVDSEIVGQIFSDALTHLEAENRYYNLPFQEKGSEFIKDFAGDQFSLSLDPSLEFGLGSCAFNSESLEQKPCLFIENNKVQENLVSSQIGQYLNMPTTTTIGNMVIEAKGSQTREEM